jgi:NADPH-dependent curcumin reductase CurA
MRTVNRQWILTRRPTGLVGDGDFALQEAAVPTIGPGEALVRVLWLGFDATQRGWLNEGPNYLAPVALGEVMRGAGVGVVVASNSDQYAVGEYVAGMVGWQDYVVAGGQGLFGVNVVPPGIDPKAMLSLFGSNGLTAYFGMVDIGRIRPGDTVVVSAAAGATGSIAGQVAKALGGGPVIGIAGGPAKCAWVTDVAGFDSCIDYKSEDVDDRLRWVAPDGVDVFFDNVGGPVLDTVLAHLARRARIVVCGAVASGYEPGQPPHGPRNYLQLGIKRARMEGFVFLDHVDRFPEAFAALHTWMIEGRMVYAEDTVDGLENAPAALRRLFEGRNHGKQLLRVAGGDF